MKYILVLFAMMMVACAEENKAADPNPIEAERNLFSTWTNISDNTDVLYLDNLTFGSGNIIFPMANDDMCNCFTITTGTQTSGTVYMHTCVDRTGLRNAQLCGSMEFTTYAYVKNLRTLEICNTSTASCSTYK